MKTPRLRLGSFATLIDPERNIAPMKRDAAGKTSSQLAALLSGCR